MAVSEENKSRVRVKILNEEFSLKGDLPPSVILDVAGIVDDKMKQLQEVNPKLSLHKVAVLASINLALEYRKLQDDYKELETLINESE